MHTKKYTINLDEYQLSALISIAKDNEELLSKLGIYTEHSYIGNLWNILDEKPLIKDFKCRCGQEHKVHILEVYNFCSSCGTTTKMYPYCAEVEYNIEYLIKTIMEYLQLGVQNIPSFRALHKLDKET